MKISSRHHVYLPFLFLVLVIHGSILFIKLKEFRDETEAVGAQLKVQIIDEDKLRQKKQIVQSEDSESSDIPDDAYLSDKNRKFDRETRSRKIDKFKKAAQEGGGGGKKSEDIKLSDLGALPKEHDPFREAAKNNHQKKPGQRKAHGHETLSSTNDHLPNVPLGDVTNLNSAEYKYYGFYHRIRQRLEQFWGRSIQEKAEILLREGRTLAESQEHTTSLKIIMNDRGKIISISVIGSSGIRELDDAAIESMNDAGPFPNPPKGLIVNGKVTIEWGFVVKT